MTKILLLGQTYTCVIERRIRRTLQLEIRAPYELRIKAPASLADAEILRILQKKTAWIREKNARLAAVADTSATALADGAALPFLGRARTLRITASLRKSAVRLASDALLINVYAPACNELPALLLNWYAKQARTLLPRRTAFWCEKIGTSVERIAIKDQKTRWGSCSSLGNINYNWRIIMAPEPTIDYLVIHEVSHRIHLNHSPAFWRLVQTHCPDYRSHKLWLKEHGASLFQIL